MKDSQSSRHSLAKTVGIVAVVAYLLATALVGGGLWIWLSGRGEENLLSILFSLALLGIPGIYRGLTRFIAPSMPVEIQHTTTERMQVNGEWANVTRTTGRSSGLMSRRGSVVLMVIGIGFWFAGVTLTVAIPLYADFTYDPVEECRHSHEESDFIHFEPCQDACDDHTNALGCRLVSRGFAESAGYGNTVGRDFDQSLKYARRACEFDDQYCGSVAYHECLADPEVCRGLCQMGDARNCFWLAKLYRNTYNRVEYDRSTADRYELRACVLGRESSCKYGFSSACKQGIAGCDKTCREGDAVRCGWLSRVFRDGRGDTLPDPVKSEEYAELACELDREILPDCAN